ncbi:MAG: polysaccharide deacetylase family protein [Hyphomicrobiaceae bacterium]|nr:polysaccharide deacetylase family protein [Hyphomicrobiaceae bacterium]
MGRQTTRMLRALFSTLHYSGADQMLAPYTRGLGAILKLHHVRPQPDGAPEPNRGLKVTPEFLERTITLVRSQGFEILSLDGAHARLVEGEGEHKPFVCFTFDDGYRDILEHAYPIFKRHKLPFAVYVATDYADGHGDLWWAALEMAVAAAHVLDVKIEGLSRRLACGSPQQKEVAFQTLYWWLRTLHEADARDVVRELCEQAGVDSSGLTRRLVMGWDEIRELARDDIVTIGAHTRKHFALSQLPLAAARAEMVESIDRVSFETDRQCRHFSYPYGDGASAGQREFELAAELNMKTAVTSRAGTLRPEAAQALTALPRIAIDGDYQKPRYVKVLINGAPSALAGLVERRALRHGGR